MQVIGIIPTRYNSSRFPGKPLALIGGKPMVCHVYERASVALPGMVWVATDDKRIYDAVVEFGGQAVMTSCDCVNGTSRCLDALQDLPICPDVVINIQGDEPFIDPEDINLVASQFRDVDVKIATMARRFDPQEGFDALFSPDNVKVTMDCYSNALYFSRAIIPYVRDYKWQEWLSNAEFYIHVGMYGYRADTLAELISLPASPQEQSERLEQLRWLGNGYKIKLALTRNHSIGVDTPEDFEAACKYYNELNKLR